MSENDLIHAAKRGDTTALLELWETWKRFIYLKCVRYMQEGAPYTMDDIMQTAFIGFSKGVELYDTAEKCGLMTYALYHIKNAIRRDLLGIGLKKNPLDNAVSLDTPLQHDDDLLLSDTIEDKDTINIEEYIIWQDAGVIIHKAVEQLNQEQQELIRLRFYEGLQYNHISKITGLSVRCVRDSVQRAQHRLLKLKCVRQLKDELFPPKDYRALVDYTAIYNIEADNRFWRSISKEII